MLRRTAVALVALALVALAGTACQAATDVTWVHPDTGRVHESLPPDSR